MDTNTTAPAAEPVKVLAFYSFDYDSNLVLGIAQLPLTHEACDEIAETTGMEIDDRFCGHPSFWAENPRWALPGDDGETWFFEVRPV